MRTPHPRHRRPTPKRRPRLRSLLSLTGLIGVTLLVVLVGTGASYALWNSTARSNAAVITSGTTGLTVNGQAQSVLSGLDTSKLGPGLSVVAPVTLANTGTTRLSVTATGTTVTGVPLLQAQALADQLTLTLTSSETCAPGLSGGTTGRLAGFATPAMPIPLAAGASASVCLEVKMNADAPTSVQNSTVSFTVSLSGAQVR